MIASPSPSFSSYSTFRITGYRCKKPKFGRTYPISLKQEPEVEIFVSHAELIIWTKERKACPMQFNIMNWTEQWNSPFSIVNLAPQTLDICIGALDNPDVILQPIVRPSLTQAQVRQIMELREMTSHQANGDKWWRNTLDCLVFTIGDLFVKLFLNYYGIIKSIVESLKVELARAIDAYSNGKTLTRPFSSPALGSMGHSSIAENSESRMELKSRYVGFAKELDLKQRAKTTDAIPLPIIKSQSEKTKAAKPLVLPRKKFSVNIPPINEKFNDCADKYEVPKSRNFSEPQDAIYETAQPPPAWLQLSMSRQFAGAWLSNKKINGKFLIRQATEIPDTLSLDIYYEGRVIRTHIVKEANSFYHLKGSETELFKTIEEFVNHYRVNPLYFPQQNGIADVAVYLAND